LDFISFVVASAPVLFEIGIAFQIWHRRCFNCIACHRSLDSTNLNDGPDEEIYCGGCYRKQYGPHGVGYGMGAGTLCTF